MGPYKIFMFPLVTVFFATQVCSQTEKEGFEPCDAGSFCTQLRNCLPYRQMRNWTNVEQTCGYGPGAYRRVCCPRSYPLTYRATRPSRRTPPPEISPNSEQLYEQCGTIRMGSQTRNMPLLINNTIETEGNWPWLAAIESSESSGRFTHSCTGVLIDTKHVMSAAQCFENNQADRYRVLLGSVDPEAGEEYTITRIVVPRGYVAGSFDDDIAILTLSRDATTPNIVPICLPDSRIINKDLTGKETTVAGWVVDRQNGQYSRFLRKLSGIPIISNQECNRTFQTLQRGFQRMFPRGITSGFLCTRNERGVQEFTGGHCMGDGGSPLMLLDRNRWYAVGITAFGVGCGEAGQPEGYTRVTSYLDWIRENTRD